MDLTLKLDSASLAVLQAFTLGVAATAANQTTQLNRIEAKVDALTKAEATSMQLLDDAISTLTAQVAAEETVEGSALVLIQGFPALLATAVQQAQAAGATPAQLASITTLGKSMTDSSNTLAAAVAAGTPAAGPPPISGAPGA